MGKIDEVNKPIITRQGSISGEQLTIAAFKLFHKNHWGRVFDEEIIEKYNRTDYEGIIYPEATRGIIVASSKKGTDDILSWSGGKAQRKKEIHFTCSVCQFRNTEIAHCEHLAVLIKR